jgi:hypothetical protein
MRPGVALSWHLPAMSASNFAKLEYGGTLALTRK